MAPLLLGLALIGLPTIPTTANATPTPTPTPNFVVIVTDDQRWDTIGRCLNGFDGLDLAAGADSCMPTLQDRLVANGTSFLRGYVPTSLCCPSRASILTGQYGRHTGVLNNTGSNSLPAFRDASTMATWLDAGGYRTGLFGKYLNGYGDPGPLPPNYVPPGWDAWYGLSGDQSRYTTYSLVQRDPGGIPSTVSYSGSATAPTPCASGVTYLTDHLCRRALDFLAADTQTPFFLYFAPLSPHEPYTPASRHTGVYDGVTPPTYPNYNAAPSPNPPRWLPTAPLSASRLTQIGTDFRNMLSANRAVDDAIERLWTRLADDGRLEETVWIFISDNGVAQAEHRYVGKPCEYEECHKVPFVVACPPGICPGAVGGQIDAQHLALNIDIAPTIAELAGVTPAHRVDGTSLVPLLMGQPSSWRTEFPLEDHGTGTIVQAPLGVLSQQPDGHTYKLVSFTTKPGFELFDLTSDPWELSNQYANPAFASVRASLLAAMNDIQTPPSMTLAGPTAGVAAGELRFTWTASQPAAVECRLDGEPFSPCGSGTSGAITLVDLSPDPHTFDLRGIDVDNNVSAVVSRSFALGGDEIPPGAGDAAEVFASSFTVVVGSALSGTVASLAADDDSSLVVGSTTKGVRTATWYGTFTAVSNSIASLAATYAGTSTLTCTQVIAIWRWTDSTWVTLDSRTVGTVEVTVSNLAPPGSPADFVSGASGNGDVRVRVGCSTAAGSFTLSADLLKLAV